MPQSYPDATITFPMFGSGFKYTAPEIYHLFGLPLHWYGTIDRKSTRLNSSH